MSALRAAGGPPRTQVEHPAIMNHPAVPPETWRLLAIDDECTQLSVGIESGQGLVDDLTQALDRS